MLPGTKKTISKPDHEEIRQKDLQRLFRAITANDKKYFNNLFKLDKTLFTEIDKDNHTVMHIAAANSNPDFIKQFCKHFPELVNKSNRAGSTPLHAAATQSNVQVIKNLVEAKADAQQRDNHGQTPLHAAVSAGEEKTLVTLSKLVRLEAFNKDGHTALLLAAFNGEVNVLTCLVEQCGANLHQTRPDGSTILHVAAMSKKLSREIIYYLVTMKQIDVNIKNKLTGRTAAQVAIMNGGFETLNHLIKTYKAQVPASDNQGNNLAHLAVFSDDPKMLIHVVDKYSSDANATNLLGETPVLLAAKFGKLQVLKHLHETLQVKTDCKTKNGSTLLHYAVESLKPEVIEYTLNECKADIHAVDHIGQTVLHRLALKSNPANEKSIDAIFKLLIQAGANQEAKDIAGMTPLRIAGEKSPPKTPEPKKAVKPKRKKPKKKTASKQNLEVKEHFTTLWERPKITNLLRVMDQLELMHHQGRDTKELFKDICLYCSCIKGWKLALDLTIEMLIGELLKITKESPVKDPYISIANFILGCFKFIGYGVEKDTDTAKELFIKAFDLGYKPAQYYLERISSLENSLKHFNTP